MKKVLALLLACVFVFSACGQKTNDDAGSAVSEVSEMSEISEVQMESGKPVVYASTDALYDFAKAIAGERAEVRDLMPGIVDAHHWEPTPQTIVELNSAKMLLLNGAGFEMWLEDFKASLDGGVELVDCDEHVELLKSSGEHHHDHEDADHDEHDHEDADHSHDEHEHESEAQVMESVVAEAQNSESAVESHDEHDHEDIEHSHEEHEHHHGEFDPHYWLSVEEAENQAKAVYEAFVKMDKEGEAEYKANYEALLEKFHALEKDYDEALKEFEGKSILVPHKAFGYLAHEYNLEQIAIEGMLADGQPNAGKMSEIIDLAKEQGIKAVFYDAYGDAKAAEQVATEIGAKTLPIYTLESISDEDRANGEDYFTLMHKNLDNLVKSFKGVE